MANFKDTMAMCSDGGKQCCHLCGVGMFQPGYCQNQDTDCGPEHHQGVV